MQAKILQFDEPVTLVGGGALDAAMFGQALALAPVLVAADGGADRARALGQQARVVIGDMDSLNDPAAWRDCAQVLDLSEQNTTDFEKCLYSVEAPFFVAAGFTGRRVDHMLAVFHAMVRRPEKPVFLIGETEVTALLPLDRAITVEVGTGAVVSLFPLLPARGVASEGLKWPIGGLDFAVGRQVGTSNRAIADRISVEVDGPGVLLMLPRRCLESLVRGVLDAG